MLIDAEKFYPRYFKSFDLIRSKLNPFSLKLFDLIRCSFGSHIIELMNNDFFLKIANKKIDIISNNTAKYL